MTTGPMDGNWRFREGEEFRERVIRQAMLLGFSAEEYDYLVTVNANHQQIHKRWRFAHGGAIYTAYASLYSAALEFLRINGVPHEVIGGRNARTE